MNEEFLGELITYIISDPSDSSFMKSVCLGLEKLPQEYQVEDTVVLIKLIRKLLENDIKDTKQAIRLYDNGGFTDNIKEFVDFLPKVNKRYKGDLLEQLYSLSMCAELNPLVDRIQDAMRDMEAGNPGKSRSEYRKSILEYITDLQKRAFVFGGTRREGRMLIIDPESGLGDSSEDVYNDVQHSATNRVKTIQAFDMLCGGGMLPGSLYMVCHLSGHGKSLVMQNLAIYAAINNDPADLDMEDGLKPCILFISYEMKKTQLLQRQLSFFNKNMSMKDMAEVGSRRLNEIIHEESIKHGLKMPVIYDDQITPEESSDKGMGQPTIDDIERSVSSLKSNGYLPIFICVDYIGLMGSISKRSRNLNESGSEGSTLLSIKAKELRDLAGKLKIPILTAQQLDSDAYSLFAQMQAYLKSLDIIATFGENMLRGSKQVRDIVEALIFGDMFKIPKHVEGSAVIQYDNYLALNVKKDRDNQASYIYSERDRQTAESYRKMTEKVKNDAQTRRFFQEPANPMVVIPLVENTIKLHPEDYGKSVRTFYCNSQGGVVDFGNIKDDNIDLDEAFSSIESDMNFDDDSDVDNEF